MGEENDAKFMAMAIGAAMEGVNKGQSPFGACIVKDGRVVACMHNTVWMHTDITRHAEMNAIKDACDYLETIDLKGCTIYSTTEPCPMCFTAIHWAGISRIVSGATIDDAASFGFNELHVSNEHLAEHQEKKIRLKQGFMRDECVEIFNEWKNREGRNY